MSSIHKIIQKVHHGRSRSYDSTSSKGSTHDGPATAKSSPAQHHQPSLPNSANSNSNRTSSTGASSPSGRSRRLSFTEQKLERKAEREEKDRAEAEARAQRMKTLHRQDPLRERYGDLPLNQSQSRDARKFDTLPSLVSMQPGTRVTVRARVHHMRPLSSKIVFLILRHQLTTVQAVLVEEAGVVSHNMIHWAEGISRESIVTVEGVIQTPQDGQDEVRFTTIHNVEIKVEKLFVVAHPTVTLPFQVEDVSRPADTTATKVGDHIRFDNRVLDLRSPANQAIFRIHHAVTAFFRQALTERGFIEINSTKLQESGTESGAAVFKVDYFRRPAFLAQSPQLAKQMAIAADMERVFEIGPVFRAEKSNTHRHLTEFTGLDLEMAIESHYHEVMDVIDEMLLTIFKGLQREYRAEIETVKKLYPHDDLVFLDKTLRLTFSEGIQLLRESGWKDDNGNEPSDEEDLSTPAERRLGQLVKEKYGTDYYILDKFPLAVRPFYTMPDPTNPKFSNSFDIFVRGEEILSGAQRIHDAPLLLKRMEEARIEPETMKAYIDGFRFGAPPHGGGGIGLERLVMLFLRLGDIRRASLIPRDPKSFASPDQVNPAEVTQAAAAAIILHGPESTTLQPGKSRRTNELPPLGNLIAKYGDATNTSWLDPAWTVWRHRETGAAVGYIPQNGFAVTFGNPLAERDQLPHVIKAYLRELERLQLKPVWCCVDKETESYLALELGWTAIMAVAEERLDPTEVDPAHTDKGMRRKIHRAEREGVKVHEVEGLPSDDLQKRIEQRCRDWNANRKGNQIHLTGVRPFDDIAHRRYFYATDRNGEICAMVVLAQLAPVHGFQIKWALEFPHAPAGAIEFILSHVIKKLGEAGVRSTTFGAGAADHLERVDNVGGFRVRALERAYNGLSHTFHLHSKGDFRSKFGIEQDPLYICYPKGHLGLKGIEAIMQMLQKPKSGQ